MHIFFGGKKKNKRKYTTSYTCFSYTRSRAFRVRENMFSKLCGEYNLLFFWLFIRHDSRRPEFGPLKFSLFFFDDILITHPHYGQFQLRNKYFIRLFIFHRRANTRANFAISILRGFVIIIHARINNSAEYFEMNGRMVFWSPASN